jgi:hypothetical protein
VSGCYDWQGRLLDPVEWLRQVEQDCLVERTVVDGFEIRLVVETVWVGLDLERTADSRPCVFWTGIRGYPALFWCTPDEREARRVHGLVVSWLEAHLHPQRPARPSSLLQPRLEEEG